MYRIRLENTVTHQIYEQEVVDANNGEKLYFRFGINTADLVDGEYILTLLNSNGDVLVEDILRIGNFNPNTIQYNKGENTYISMELDAVLGEKSAVVTDINSKIIPDNGVDGLTAVYVDAQPVYDSGYNDGFAFGEQESYHNGYNDGIADGERITKENMQSITITENGEYTDERGYNTVNVDVVPSVNVKNNLLKFGHSQFSRIPDWMDFTNISDVTYLFYYCRSLVEAPFFDTSTIYDMAYMFNGCSNLETVPHYDTSNVKDFTAMFYNCSKLETIPPYDTTNAEDFYNVFYNCTALKTLPALNASKLNVNDSQSARLFGSSALDKLTDFGGLIGLRRKMDDNYGFIKTPNLTYDSCINILNGLYDFTGNGESPTSNEGKLKVHQNFLNTVGDNISIGTNKGWVITT